jgi:hypothetical protein
VSGRYSIVRGDVRTDKREMLELALRNRPGPLPRIEAKYRKYYENSPLGEPALFLARENESGGLVGMSALFPTTLWIAGRTVPAAIGGDFAVDEGHRGFCPALALQRATVQALPELGAIFAYGSPNQFSELVVARAGYADLGRLTRFVKLLSARPAVKRYVKRPRLASLAAGVAQPLVSMLSRERLYKRPEGFSVAQPERFDDRFTGLWEEARRQPGVTSERSAELLNWRYAKTGMGGDPGMYSIFALMEGEEVAGYVVYRMGDDDSRLVYDFLCRPERRMVDALISELVRDARARRAVSIDFGYLGASNLVTERLRAFGFLQRTAENGLLVCSESGAAPAVDLERADSWYFTSGDTDF